MTLQMFIPIALGFIAVVVALLWTTSMYIKEMEKSLKWRSAANQLQIEFNYERQRRLDLMDDLSEIKHDVSNDFSDQGDF